MFNSQVGRALLQAARNMEDELELPAASRMTTPHPARTPSESSLTPLSYTSVPVPLDNRSPTPFPSTPAPAPTSTPSTGRSRTLTAGQKGMLKLVNTSIVMLDDIKPEHPLYAPFTDCILRAAHVLIKRRDLDGYKTSSVAGIGSFSEQLAKIIGSVDPPPRAFESTPPPPTPSGTATPRPRSPSADMDMTPRKLKKAKPAQPTPPPPPQPPVFGKDPVPSKNNSYAKAAACRLPQQRPPPHPQAPAAPAAVAPTTPASKPSGKKRRARRTCHGASRRGVHLTPPAGSSIRAAHVSPAMLAEINTHLKNDVGSDVILKHSEDSGSGIFIAASRVLNSSETACVLKHIRRLVTVAGVVPIKSTPVTSTSYLKVIDVPMVPAEPKVWQSTQRSAFTNALSISPVGKELSIAIKHAVRFMRTSAHSDTCVAWVDICDSVAGTSARSYIGKTIVINGRNCQIRGAAPWPGSALCTRCMRWGHHSSAHSTYCAHSKRDPDARSCVNCSAAGKTKRDHSATDTSCPFWQNQFDRDWLRRQFPKK
ncbi:hypothetical protein AGABI1DRAFT_133560 [Agaricus bisporus var. burnettii JB137-S8]|uniref:Uncharacterized protein n=1 Tax=Agaricus bisporus var. burnettii (strain JB137-S8 / ATCC MYA-4627 / FGSC 10392) TaxID=597362 RepID=K5XIA0_AGABU|nr:uncharacterized protein AGABI1DRAFT_133560 [Agaricus bisporus var. burnettii JB137-S8]EKM74160.1 hypothetical protein AGABI1DRAFT_133560 [Agaricus bisporus var. burnettii JB137-S8]